MLWIDWHNWLWCVDQQLPDTMLDQDRVEGVIKEQLRGGLEQGGGPNGDSLGETILEAASIYQGLIFHSEPHSRNLINLCQPKIWHRSKLETHWKPVSPQKYKITSYCLTACSFPLGVMSL